MKKDELTSMEPAAQGETGTVLRLAYEAPELIAYNQSRITMGGINVHISDLIGGATTSYKS
jgi:hypothetical protein